MRVLLQMVFFRYRKGDRLIIPTLLGLQIIAWVTAGDRRSLFLFPACVLMSGTGGVLMTNDGKCLLRRKREQKRCFSQTENKDGTRKTKSSAFKGERAPFKPVFLRASFYYTEGEKKWNGG